MDFSSLLKQLGPTGNTIPFASIANMGSGLLNSQFLQDGELTSKEASIQSAISMAGTGASLGSALGPIGTGIGLGGGAIYGAINGKRQFEKAEHAKQEMFNQQAEIANDRLIDNGRKIAEQYNSKGVFKHSLYKNGGNAGGDYLVEDGEVLLGQSPKIDHSGLAKELASGMFEFEGATHDSPSKGIGVSDTEGFVFSNRLKTDPSKYLKNL